MKFKNNSDLVITISIILLVLIICYNYNNIHNIENFTQTDPETTNPPESTYNLQQYIETNPPTGSKVIKTEISHEFPNLMDSDMIIKDKNDKIIHTFGQQGTYTAAGELHGDTLKSTNDIIVGRKAIIKGGLTTDKDTLVKGYLTADKNAFIKGVLTTGGNTVVKGGLTTEKNTLLKGYLTAEKNAFIKGGLTTGGNTQVKGNLNVIGSIINNGKRIGDDSNSNHKAKQYYATEKINVKDANIRERLYFRDAKENEDPRNEIIAPAKGLYGQRNASYIESIDDTINIYSKTIKFENPIKTITLPNGHIQKHYNMPKPVAPIIRYIAVEPIVLNKNQTIKFSVKLFGNGTILYVTRLDNIGTWHFDPEFTAWYETKDTNNEKYSHLKLVMSDSNDSFDIYKGPKMIMRFDGRGNIYTQGKVIEGANL